MAPESHMASPYVFSTLDIFCINREMDREFKDPFGNDLSLYRHKSQEDINRFKNIVLSLKQVADAKDHGQHLTEMLQEVSQLEACLKVQAQSIHKMSK